MGLIGVDGPMKDILFWGKEKMLNDERTAIANSVRSFEASFGASSFCKHLNLNLMCNHYT
jgi:hypothetical protein